MTGRVVVSRDERLDVIKTLIALVRSDRDPHAAGAWAEKRWGSANRPHYIERAGGVLSSGEIGAENLMDTALFSAVREQAILFRLNGIRRTSFNTRSLTVSGTVANWIGEGAPTPFYKPTFDPRGLDPYKLGAGTVATKEALDKGRDVEKTIFAELTRAIVDELDATFLDPTNAGIADVTPAAVTYDAASTAATSDPVADLKALVEAFGGNLRTSYFTMNSKTAARLAGTEIGRDIGIRGGELLGAPVLTSEAGPATSIALIDPTGIQAAHDDNIMLSSSEAGAIEVDEEPTQDAMTATGAQLVSLFQLNLMGFKGKLAASWQRAEPGSVAVLEGGASDWLA